MSEDASNGWNEGNNWPYVSVFLKVFLLPLLAGMVFLAGLMLYFGVNSGGVWRGFTAGRDSLEAVAAGFSLFFLPPALLIAIVVSGLRLYRSLLTSMAVCITAALVQFLWWIFCDKYITQSLLVLESVSLLAPLTLAYAVTAQLVLPKKAGD